MSTNAIELPLFPLNTVLFPGMVMPLHIFEPRYRQMIADCQQQHSPFGMVLARPTSRHLHEEPYSIGTIAEMHNLNELEDGRFTLIALGTQRFRILSQHHDKPYLSGIVEPYTDTPELMQDMTHDTDHAHTLFSKYLEMLLEAANEKSLAAPLPYAPEELSYFIAYFLDIEDERKQHFLELTSTHQRLKEEIAILSREVPFMQQILTMRSIDEDHSMLN